MSNDFFRDLQEDALRAMKKKAKDLDIHRGVAITFIYVESPADFHEPSWTRVEGKHSRDPDPTREGDTGANYLAVAFVKLAVSFATGMSSGNPVIPLRFGELSLRGCLTDFSETGYRIFAAFSGGTEDQDVEIAQAGLNFLKRT
jgi:hypothetical protein